MNETLKRIEQDAVSHNEYKRLFKFSEPINGFLKFRQGFVAGAISERNKFIDELINLTDIDRRITITADYLNSLKIPTK